MDTHTNPFTQTSREGRSKCHREPVERHMWKRAAIFMTKGILFIQPFCALAFTAVRQREKSGGWGSVEEASLFTYPNY